jgi:DNA-binding NarL/FixJ family response regulator
MPTVLILDDDPLIALGMAMTVEDAGDAQVIVAGTLNEAAKLDLNDLDVAVLDVNLGSQTSYAFARQLLDAGIPIAFASGSQKCEMPVDLRDVLFLSKPCCRSKMLDFDRQALTANVARHSRH